MEQSFAQKIKELQIPLCDAHQDDNLSFVCLQSECQYNMQLGCVECES